MVSAVVACAFNFSLGFFFVFVVLFYCYWSMPQISFDILPMMIVPYTYSFSLWTVLVPLKFRFACVFFPFRHFDRWCIFEFFFLWCAQIDHIYNLVYVHVVYKSSWMFQQEKCGRYSRTTKLKKKNRLTNEIGKLLCGSDLLPCSLGIFSVLTAYVWIRSY